MTHHEIFVYIVSALRKVTLVSGEEASRQGQLQAEPCVVGRVAFCICHLPFRLSDAEFSFWVPWEARLGGTCSGCGLPGGLGSAECGAARCRAPSSGDSGCSEASDLNLGLSIKAADFIFV